MGPLLVGAAGLMWGHVVVAGPSPGGGLGALRLLPAGTLGSCGSCGAARLLPWVTLGSIGVVCTIRGIMLRSFERSRW